MPQKIIVIGAGVSGLASAQSLRKAHCSVVVLEARNRPGGRIWTDHEFATFPLELGAEFIHGSNSITWETIRKYRIETIHGGDYSTQAYEHPKKGLLSYQEVCKLPGYAQVFELEEKAMVQHNPQDDFSLGAVNKFSRRA